MDRISDGTKSHYHICWLQGGRLDWEGFSTIAEAEASAKRLARQDEAYVIEEADQSCERCKRKAASAS